MNMPLILIVHIYNLAAVRHHLGSLITMLQSVHKAFDKVCTDHRLLGVDRWLEHSKR